MYFAAPIRFIKGRRLNLEGEELRLELDVSSFDIEVCRNGSLEAHKWEMHLFSSSEFPEGPEWNRVLNSARQRKTWHDTFLEIRPCILLVNSYCEVIYRTVNLAPIVAQSFPHFGNI
ncbi:uncharacterized protein LOC132615589 isoform X2 [Lycium barbarum]|uniref:uncharacterized protein LOC132615589 isoform X2 n=1 Tax=Lycium barbarum TaxID=112863 RepID=UPI00293E1C38|nr:uncharacterized protein LOC132615589 isoform X2 [Lycium barbarum]